MDISRTTTAINRSDWRAWLEKNHATASEIWLVYYKKDTGKPSVSYPESLEEALCFGWIDSIIQKIDAEKYARKFNPRRPGSKWSELNRHLVAKLVGEGRMTAAGLSVVDFPLPDAGAGRPKHPELPLPEWLKAALMTSPKGWEHFNLLAPSHRRNYIGWILQAKREDTRQRRIAEAIARLERKETLGWK
jgi:uncharacterized protein YdeI (YjbR/CyaY-like superfamily)